MASRLIVLVLAVLAATTSCSRETHKGWLAVSNAHADALEVWVKHQKRPHSFTFVQETEFGVNVYATRITVIDQKIHSVEPLDRRASGSISTYHITIDDLMKRLALVLLENRNEEHLAISARYDEDSGIPLKFSMDVGFTFDDAVTWRAYDLEFLDD